MTEESIPGGYTEINVLSDTKIEAWYQCGLSVLCPSGNTTWTEFSRTRGTNGSHGGCPSCLMTGIVWIRQSSGEICSELDKKDPSNYCFGFTGTKKKVCTLPDTFSSQHEADEFYFTHELVTCDKLDSNIPIIIIGVVLLYILMKGK